MSSMFEGAPAAVTDQSTELLDKYLAAVKAVLDALKDPRLQQLVMIKSSPKYVERLAQSLRQYLTSSERMTASAAAAKVRKQTLTDTVGKSIIKLKSVVATTSNLKAKTEASVSALLKGVKVNIVGEINNLLDYRV
jgi:hypothetical protein